MSFFSDGPFFDPFGDACPPYTPIERLRELRCRAKNLLRGRTTEQLKEASKAIDILIEDYFEREKEEWIRDQIDNGGSILRFLDFEDRTESGLRYFISACHDADICAEIDFPQEENTRELDALECSLFGFYLDDKSFPDAKAFEYLAVLALKQIARTIDSFSDGRGDDWPVALKADAPMILLRGIANDAIDIMETVCRAESLRDIHRAEKRAEQLLIDEMSNAIPKKAEALAKKKVSLAARKAAIARHKEHHDGKASALAEWDANGDSYSSLAAFARHRHKAYEVTERTLYEWVRGSCKPKA